LDVVAFVARSRFWVVIPELKNPISLRCALALKINASVGHLGLKLGNLLRLFEIFSSSGHTTPARAIADATETMGIVC
jgi:hypothetical protein